MSSDVVKLTLAISIIITVIEIICFIVTASSACKLKEMMKKQLHEENNIIYPDKTIELLQAIVSMQQKTTAEIENLRKDIRFLKTGAEPGMKTKETQHHEELMKQVQNQTEMIEKLIETASGDEKKQYYINKLEQAKKILNEI